MCDDVAKDTLPPIFELVPADTTILPPFKLSPLVILTLPEATPKVGAVVKTREPELIGVLALSKFTVPVLAVSSFVFMVNTPDCTAPFPDVR